MSELKTNKISTNDQNNVAIDNALGLKSYTTTARNALTSVAGDMISNTSDSKPQFYNGSAWTAGNAMNNARGFYGATGTQTSTLYFGGASPNTAATESWDGSSWTEVGDMNTARYETGRAGESNTSALVFGGTTGSLQVLTEQWDGSNPTSVIRI